MNDVIIIGWGPAGLTAAIYTARAGLSTLLFEGFMAGGLPPGGQLTLTTEVENFPGFPTGISGLELMKQMKQQAIKFWTNIETKTIDRIEASHQPFTLFSWETTYQSKSIIIATGAIAKRLHVPGENKFRQRGISVCATCDGNLPVFRDQTLVVVGGGNMACSEALYLSRFWKEIIMLVRKNYLRATKIIQDKVFENPKIHILFNTQLVECLGDKHLTSIKIINTQTNQETTVETKGVFYAIGHEPNTAFLKGILEINDDGFLVTEAGTGKTNIPGIFAAGDVQDTKYRQAITAAGSGAIAAIEAEKFLTSQQRNK